MRGQVTGLAKRIEKLKGISGAQETYSLKFAV
jgi:hypothetical protein